jgi:uncharacterized protein YjiS (DUF1127 family)
MRRIVMVTLSGKRLGARIPRARTSRPARPANRPSGLSALLSTLYALQARSESRRALADLDDRLLRDIGLDRVDARREASKPFWTE